MDRILLRNLTQYMVDNSNEVTTPSGRFIHRDGLLLFAKPHPMAGQMGLGHQLEEVDPVNWETLHQHLLLTKKEELPWL